MTGRYNPHRTINLYRPGAQNPFKVSRSKIDLYMNCSRCFYLDARLGTKRPPGFPFTLNSAVDGLLKKEFDKYRADSKPHPIQTGIGTGLIPAQHEHLDTWRENFKGVQYLHPKTNLLVTGAIDDLWISDDGYCHVVDYKATAKAEPVSALDQPWHDGYKRQMEVYQWLLRKNGLQVSHTGFFVYCTGRTGADAFDGRLEFDIRVIPYIGDDAWVEPVLEKMYDCLNSRHIPIPDSQCEYCAYVEAIGQHLADGEKSTPLER